MSAPWDGIPQHPERDGLHWLHCSQGELRCSEWTARTKRWLHMGDDVEWLPGDLHEFAYLGPIPPPSETARLREALRLARSYVEAVACEHGHDACEAERDLTKIDRALLGEKEAGDG